MPRAMEKPSTVPLFLAAAREALVDRGRPIAYQAVERESASVARGLRELGVRRGDRVAIWLPNVPAWLAVFVACCRLGAIAVSLNTRFKSSEIQDIVSRSGCKALVYWPDFKGIDFAGILRGCNLPAVTQIAYSETDDRGYRQLAGLPPLEEDASSPDSPCVIFTTSGTTKANPGKRRLPRA